MICLKRIIWVRAYHCEYHFGGLAEEYGAQE